MGISRFVITIARAMVIRERTIRICHRASNRARDRIHRTRQGRAERSSHWLPLNR